MPLIAITAYFNPGRLEYLASVLTSLSTLPEAHIIIVTNTFKEEELLALQAVCNSSLLNKKSEITTSIRSYDIGTNGFYLTWCHKQIISDEFIGKGYTHFIYLEDDMTFDFTNLHYFIEYRERFRDRGLIPSFLRVEYHSGLEKFVNTDNTSRINIHDQPHIDTDHFWFVNAPNPYTACFVLDQDLAAEYVQTRSFDREQSGSVCQWDVRERAAMGLCFENIPVTFNSRYVVAVSKETSTPPRYVWVRHLPNNYADMPASSFGKIPMNELFTFKDKE